MYKMGVITSKLVFVLMRTCDKAMHGLFVYDFVITISDSRFKLTLKASPFNQYLYLEIKNFC